MATTKRPPVKNGGASGRSLPVLTVDKFEAVTELVEEMVAENTSIFIAKGQRYRDQHRAGTARALSPVEAAQIASVAIDDRPVEERAHAFQTSGLQAHDEPQPMEVLAAAGVATAPAFVKAARKVVALVEMDNDRFEQAVIAETVWQEIDTDAKALGPIPMPEARQRTRDALEHFAVEGAGVEPEKGLGLLVQSVWQALQQAMTQMDLVSPSLSSTVSALSTGGDTETSSVSATGTPSS